MNLSVSLDDQWVNDYEDTIAELIQQEINEAVRAEVKRVINKIVKDHVETLRKQIETQLKKSTPESLARLFLSLEKS